MNISRTIFTVIAIIVCIVIILVIGYAVVVCRTAKEDESEQNVSATTEEVVSLFGEE